MKKQCIVFPSEKVNMAEDGYSWDSNTDNFFEEIEEEDCFLLSRITMDETKVKAINTAKTRYHTTKTFSHS